MAHNGSVFVRDLNTTHGTVVGGHRLKRGETRELFAGESISFGETNPFVSLFFRADATPPPAAHASSLGDDAPPLSACHWLSMWVLAITGMRRIREPRVRDNLN